ncbi:ATPase-like protein [Candidatus Magnetomorum sp. HK-1]|nr:ATPase-like protein [Candidatus Magnetomorum sp. HK-1]
MIESFKIKGYKLFDDLFLQRLNLITLIGGKNNTGKTTVLEAFFMFHDSMNPEAPLHHLSLRGLGSISLNPEYLWSSIFQCYDMHTTIEMEVFENNIKEKIFIKHNKELKKSVFTLPQKTAFITNTSQKSLPMESLNFIYSVNDKYVGESYLTFNGQHLEMNFKDFNKTTKKVAFISSGKQQDHLEDAIRFGQLDIYGDTEIITDVLKIIEPNLKSLTTISQGDHALIYGKINLPKKIPVSHMGEGTAKLLSILLAIATHENGMLLIDEIENGWHYSLLPDILKAIHKMAKKYNCQIIATTHSYEIKKSLIKGLSPENLLDITYIRLDKKKEKIKPKIYEPAMLVAALERGWETR